MTESTAGLSFTLAKDSLLLLQSGIEMSKMDIGMDSSGVMTSFEVGALAKFFQFPIDISR